MAINKIIYFLKQKGIREKDIQIGLDEIDEEKYIQLLKKTIREKARKTKGNNKYDKMGRIIRFVQSRGFEPELIHRYLNTEEL